MRWGRTPKPENIPDGKLLTAEIAETAAEFAENSSTSSRYLEAAASWRTVAMNVLVARVRVRSRR